MSDHGNYSSLTDDDRAEIREMIAEAVEQGVRRAIENRTVETKESNRPPGFDDPPNPTFCPHCSGDHTGIAWGNYSDHDCRCFLMSKCPATGQLLFFTADEFIRSRCPKHMMTQWQYRAPST